MCVDVTVRATSARTSHTNHNIKLIVCPAEMCSTLLSFVFKCVAWHRSYQCLYHCLCVIVHAGECCYLFIFSLCYTYIHLIVLTHWPRRPVRTWKYDQWECVCFWRIYACWKEIQIPKAGASAKMIIWVLNNQCRSYQNKTKRKRHHVIISLCVFNFCIYVF